MAPRQPRRATLSYLTDVLPTVVPPIFEQAQNTMANHRKNIVQLRKVQETCATLLEPVDNGMRRVGERAFNALFVDMVNRVLPIKKGVAVADRIVKFVASFVAYTVEQDAAKDEAKEEAEGMASRFVSKLLRHLLSGMEAKDKNVRFRVTLMTSSLINGLPEIDDDLYQGLRFSLLRRARDKEAVVRVQAALGLSKLQAGEEEEDLEEGQEPLAQILLDLLRYDPSPDVRRAVLYNLPRTIQTLPYIIARTRDVDPILRRTVYHGCLSTASIPDMRVLSIAQREEVVTNGLGDRQANVRKATAIMLGGWLDQSEGDLLEFLSRFDVVASPAAEDALLSVFTTRPDVFEAIEFPVEWWQDITPDKAFLARVFADHCIATKNEARLEETLPVVSALALKIQEVYNTVVTVVTDQESDQAQESAFIVKELLRLAALLDYADEIGRRKMFQLAREMVAQPLLPEILIDRCMDVLLKISEGERDLIRLIVDVVTMMREGDGDEEMTEPPQTPRRPTSPSKAAAPMTEEEKRNAVITDLRCLAICISLLERVNSPLQENSVFHGLLPDLIVPAVRNTEHAILRDQGLLCLGLCCLIDEKMAANSFGLFIQQLTAADDELKVKVVRIIFDLLMVHEPEKLVAKTMSVDRVVELVAHMLQQDAPEVQAVACEGVAKLMLAGMVEDAAVLQSLVLLYFSPETADNQPLRQCLAYFLPVFCYMSPKNQRLMLRIFADTFATLSSLEEEFEDATDLLQLSQMGLMMVDWLDPYKTVGTTPDHGIHLELGVEVLRSLLTETSRDARKTLVGFLSKLNLPENTEAYAWRTKAAYQLIASIKEKRPLSDAAPRNALARFEAVLVKNYPELEAYDEEAFRAEGAEHKETAELFGFIDDVDESVESPEKPSRRTARSTSRVPRGSSVAASEVSETEATPVRRKPTKRLPEPVVEESENEESEQEQEQESSSDSSEEDESDVDGMLDSD